MQLTEKLKNSQPTRLDSLFNLPLYHSIKIKKALRTLTFIVALYSLNMLVVSPSLYAQVEGDSAIGNAIPGGQKDTVVNVEDESFSNVGKKDNLRLSGGLSFSNYGKSSQTTWRGIFDYYITNSFSFSGISSLALSPATLNNVDQFSYHFMGLGLNVHWFHFGDVDFFTGGYSGFTAAYFKDLPAKIVPTLEMNAGLIWFGSFFCLSLEVGHRRVEYKIRDYYFEIHEILVSPSIGFKM